MKQKVTAVVRSSEEIAAGIMDLWLETDLAKEAKPGQFVAVYTKDASKLLPRPISICRVDREKPALRLVYRIAGAGTKEFSTYRAGDEVEVLGILGNGYPLEEAAGKTVLLLGGGIGIPPLLETAATLSGLSGDEAPAKVYTGLGYRSGKDPKELFLKAEFDAVSEVLVATEDGSEGCKGTVLDAVRACEKLKPDVIYSCGPMPMLRAIKAYAEGIGCKAYLSLEERMACGVGACLGCVCKTVKKDEHSQVNNARICTDGPVFAAEDVDI